MDQIVLCVVFGKSMERQQSCPIKPVHGDGILRRAHGILSPFRAAFDGGQTLHDRMRRMSVPHSSEVEWSRGPAAGSRKGGVPP